MLDDKRQMHHFAEQALDKSFSALARHFGLWLTQVFVLRPWSV
ncbi:hypothetical protein [Propionivibrio sp.]|nr:hypothetical protein [Propionivibrio sp.]